MTCTHKRRATIADLNRSFSVSPVEKASRRQQWKDLHAIADKMRPKVKAAFLAAIDKIKDGVTLKDLQEAIESGNVDAIMQVIEGTGIDKKFNDMADELRAGFQEAGIKSIDHLPKYIQSEARFDLINPRSVEFIQNYEFDLITNISENVRDGIQSIVQSAFEEGGSPYEQAKDIKQYIGLTERQEVAVENYYQNLVDDGRAVDQIDRMTVRYYERQLTYRAETIARTETIRAANAGQNELWNQLAEDGLINPEQSKKFWIVTDDDLLCPICEDIAAANQDGVAIDEDFESDEGGLSEPPAHPNCRCAMGLGFDKE